MFNIYIYKYMIYHHSSDDAGMSLKCISVWTSSHCKPLPATRDSFARLGWDVSSRHCQRPVEELRSNGTEASFRWCNVGKHGKSRFWTKHSKSITVGKAHRYILGTTMSPIICPHFHIVFINDLPIATHCWEASLGLPHSMDRYHFHTGTPGRVPRHRSINAPMFLMKAKKWRG